jgi:menaquinone-dependent protoporphyrinogen oxidase
MARVLICYTTEYGYTRRIAERIAAELALSGHSADLVHMNRQQSPTGYDAVIVGAPVRNDTFLADVPRYVQRHAEQLTDLPSALYSACPPHEHRTIGHRRALERHVREFRRTTGWEPDVIATFAGGQPHATVGLAQQAFDAEKASSTDWDAVAGFVEAIVHHLSLRQHHDQLSSSKVRRKLGR